MMRMLKLVSWKADRIRIDQFLCRWLVWVRMDRMEKEGCYRLLLGEMLANGSRSLVDDVMTVEEVVRPVVTEYLY